MRVIANVKEEERKNEPNKKNDYCQKLHFSYHQQYGIVNFFLFYFMTLYWQLLCYMVRINCPIGVIFMF